MAKVNVEFDTKTKELEVTFNGKKIDNVYSVNLYKDYYSDASENPFGMSLMTLDSSKQDDEGYRSMQQIVAKESKDAKEAIEAGAGTHPDHPELLLLKRISLAAKKSLSTLMKGFRGY